ADDVAQPTSPLPPSPVIPSLPPHQLPRPSPPQAAEGSSLLVHQVLDKCSALVLKVVAASTPISAAKPAVVAVGTPISAAKPAA
nr:hypothetical protein [Tanacetum cinerariifolium]